MCKVFVLNINKQPLTPCSPRRAKILLGKVKAAVFRRFPFTIILKRSVADSLKTDASVLRLKAQPLRLKIDPGSKTTGFAIVNDSSGEVLFGVELEHRGSQIKAALEGRRALRRSRRQRKTRYRKARFLNRRCQQGKGITLSWLPPSMESRVANTVTWVNRLRRLCPIRAISQELARFDTQLMQNGEISGVEYQQGELAGYEVREYLLEKFNRKCAYCKAENLPLEIDHMCAA